MFSFVLTGTARLVKTMQANKPNRSDPGFIYNFSAVSKNIDFPLLAAEWPEKSNFKILIFKHRLHMAITIAKSLIIYYSLLFCTNESPAWIF